MIKEQRKEKLDEVISQVMFCSVGDINLHCYLHRLRLESRTRNVLSSIAVDLPRCECVCVCLCACEVLWTSVEFKLGFAIVQSQQRYHRCAVFKNRPTNAISQIANYTPENNA